MKKCTAKDRSRQFQSEARPEKPRRRIKWFGRIEWDRGKQAYRVSVVPEFAGDPEALALARRAEADLNGNTDAPGGEDAGENDNQDALPDRGPGSSQ